MEEGAEANLEKEKINQFFLSFSLGRFFEFVFVVKACRCLRIYVFFSF